MIAKTKKYPRDPFARVSTGRLAYKSRRAKVNRRRRRRRNTCHPENKHDDIIVTTIGIRHR